MKVPSVVVCMLGLALALGSAIALAAGGDRGGHAVAPAAKTTKAPLLPKQKRGWIVAFSEPSSSTGLARP